VVSVTENMLVVSTINITERACNDWLSICPWACFPKGEYGWFLYVPEDLDTQDPEIPHSIAVLISRARVAGVKWVMIDLDAKPDPHLPQYNWEREIV